MPGSAPSLRDSIHFGLGDICTAACDTPLADSSYHFVQDVRRRISPVCRNSLFFTHQTYLKKRQPDFARLGDSDRRWVLLARLVTGGENHANAKSSLDRHGLEDAVGPGPFCSSQIVQILVLVL